MKPGAMKPGYYQALQFVTFALFCRRFNALRGKAISDSEEPRDLRLEELEQWLKRVDGLTGAIMTPASTDASFRRYFRLQLAAESFIVMDAPPPQEDCLPFVRIAGYLETMNLNAPRIIEANLERGFLLLTDLGAAQYLEGLESNPERANELYGDAIDALLLMQSAGAAFQALLPSYDPELLAVELSLFHDWLCGTHLGIEFSDNEELQWQDACSLLIDNALDQPQSFVHRDYHSRNLMLRDEHNPGILDFQDAVEGPFTYDLVSLLKDCYIKWPTENVLNWANQFYARLPESLQKSVTADQFIRYFELMGVQRHLKAAGIFARLNHRDGKPGYLEDIPRTLSYIIELEGRYEELSFLIDLIKERCLPLLGRST